MDKKHKTLEDFKNLKEPVNIIMTSKQENAKEILRKQFEKVQSNLRVLHYNCMEQSLKFDFESDFFEATGDIMFKCREILQEFAHYYYNYLEKKED